MEAEPSSTQRLRQAAAGKEAPVFAKMGSWPRAELEGDGGLESREPALRGWRWLKAVSMLTFSGGRHDDETEMEPLRQPAESGGDNSEVAAQINNGAKRPQLQTTSQVQILIPPPKDSAKSGSNNSVPEVIMDVASNHLQSPQTTKVHASLTPRHAAKFEGSNNTVPKGVTGVSPRSIETAQVVAAHSATVDQMKEQQGRCFKYSQKALGFAICTFIGYTSAVALSPEDKGNTTFKLAIAPFFVAICTDLFSLKTKAKQGNVLVYLSSFHLVLMIYLIFMSFNPDYAYAILFLPLVAGASLLRQKLWPEGRQQITDEKFNKDLDNIFELSALILNWSTFITAIMAIFRDLITGPNKFIEFSAVGFLFFLTIILGLYLMLVTTVRTTAVNLSPKYLDVLLICLLVSTLIASLVSFSSKT